MRWLLRRRINRAIDELNTRLKLRIQPLKLAKRQALIDQLVFDPDVLGGLKLQVGNMVLDGTVRNRLERLRKTVAKAA